MCGKNFIRRMWMIKGAGSPPRVREELFSGILNTGYRGITPACAGRTGCRTLAIVFPWDHPRVCGKNAYKLRVGCIGEGSPPRVREELFPFNFTFPTFRITPACAGRTSFFGSLPFFRRDHPRVCGKNENGNKTDIKDKGSPPRVREEQHISIECF